MALYEPSARTTVQQQLPSRYEESPHGGFATWLRDTWQTRCPAWCTGAENHRRLGLSPEDEQPPKRRPQGSLKRERRLPTCASRSAIPPLRQRSAALQRYLRYVAIRPGQTRRGSM